MRTRRRKDNRISTRKRMERRRVIRRRVLAVLMVAALGAAAMSPDLRTYVSRVMHSGARAIQAASLEQSALITLEGKRVYALQLGAFDNGERAQAELSRLQGEGVLCVLWQRTQMRLLCDASGNKGALYAPAAGGRDAFVIEDEWPRVALRIRTDAKGIGAVKALLEMPDALFQALCAGEEPLSALLERTKPAAQAALNAYPEHALYTQLAQSLVNWCMLMDNALIACGEEAAMPYARVTMCTLCCELRQALLVYDDQSEASAA